MAQPENFLWNLGLLNSAGKYLTAETFQCKVTANGTTMKKKQIWTLVKAGENTIALRSFAGKFLKTDKDGKLDCDGKELDDGTIFELVIQDDGSMAIKNAKFGRFLGGSGDNLSCFDKDIGPTNLYKVHLAIHPQINLYNVNRSRYVHLDEASNGLNCDELIPWGYDAMIFIEFHSGKYALRAANAKYLHHNGNLVEGISNDTLYTLVFSGTQVAFRDCQGKYLAAFGHLGRLTSRKSTIGKDERFLIQDSHPQVKLLANNGKYVSVRGGIEIRANQDEATDTEIFQMEAVDRADRSGNVKWAFQTEKKMYWNRTDRSDGIVADQENFSNETAQFSIEWIGPMIALKADNSKYVSITPNGKMAAKSAELTDTCKFAFEFVNRPILVLRGEYGFVGAKGSSGTLECNRSQYDVFEMSGNAGSYQFKGANGKFWKLEGDNTLGVTGDQPTNFFLELRAHTHMAIVAPNEKYLRGQQNGGFTATGDSLASSTLWEY